MYKILEELKKKVSEGQPQLHSSPSLRVHETLSKIKGQPSMVSHRRRIFSDLKASLVYILSSRTAMVT